MVKKKKDPNFVAKIEKAIEKKYGKEAIMNPKSNWTDEKEEEYVKQVEELAKKERYEREKSEKVEKDGFLIGKKLLTKRDNRTCPICEVYSFAIKDDVYMNKYECCYECYLLYVQGNPERWKNGWRPNKRHLKGE